MSFGDLPPDLQDKYSQLDSNYFASAGPHQSSGSRSGSPVLKRLNVGGPRHMPNSKSMVMPHSLNSFNMIPNGV
jgi:hypothetical protein